MKRKLLTLSLALLSAVGLNAQVNVVEASPASNGANSPLRAPNGFTETTLRAHLIIPASDIVGLSNGDQITSVGFELLQGAAGTASGAMEFYLENTSDVTNTKSTTWTTAIGTMTNVFSGTYTIPATDGPVDMTTTSAFTYTGGGLYVAYEYIASTFGTGAAFYDCNNALPNAVVMDTTANGSIPPATLTQTSSFRPIIRLGRPNPNANDMTVNAVHPILGSASKTFTSSTDAIGLVRNTSNTTLTNVDVTLTVTGANSFTSTETITSIAAGATDEVTFTGIPTTAAGTNTYTVTVVNDDDNTNNSATADQAVGCSNHGPAPQAGVDGGLGFNQGAGIIAVALDVPSGTYPTYIKRVVPTISNDANSPGNTIKGILMNASGAIVDSTSSFTINAANLGQPVQLVFINGSVDYAGQSMFIGFRQTANTTTGYFPMGTADQFEVLANTYYTYGVNGGAGTEQTGFGAFLIDAHLEFGVDVSQSNVTLTTTTTGTGMTYQWVNCNTGANISGETGMSYTATSDIVTGSYRVDATIDGCTGSSPCTIISFVGVEESTDEALTIFPNPANDLLNITSDLKEVKSYTVYDLEGRIVLRNTIANGENLNQIDINNLVSGTYLLELISNDASARKVFVKQ